MATYEELPFILEDDTGYLLLELGDRVLLLEQHRDALRPGQRRRSGRKTRTTNWRELVK